MEPQTKTQMPEGEITIPEFYDTVKCLDQVVDVDYYLPGCPPTPKQIWAVVQVIVGGQLPPKGSVVGASEKTQCDECPRKKNEKKISSFKRIATAQPEQETCYLEQGFLCLGPVTRGGCDTRCQHSGVACRGCYGPPPGVLDQGAKAVSAIASVIESKDEAEIERILAEVPDTSEKLQPLRDPRIPLEKEDIMKRISIDPITRLEGHGKIEIFLNDDGSVANCYFQVPELRGFEKFIEGMPIEEVPRVVSRICGVCPASPPPGRGQGSRRGLQGRSSSGGQEAAGALLQRALFS